MNKEKCEIFFEVSVKGALNGNIKHLKRYVELVIDWQEKYGVPAQKNETISFCSEEKEDKNYNFILKSLRLKKGWFKDKIIEYELEPIEDEISEKITIAWGYKVVPSQIRWKNLFFLLAIAFILMAGITAFVLWKKKKRSST